MALWGVSALAPDNAASTAALIACVCLIETSLRTRVDHAVAMLRAGSAVATRKKASSPSDYLVQAAIELAVAGVLTDPQVYVSQIRAHLNQDHDEDEASTSSPA